MSSNDVAVCGWYLEYNNDEIGKTGSHKHYTILSADDGTVVFAWGRIGTRGQSTVKSVDTFSAFDVAGKQRHAKMSRGYKPEGPQDVKFVVDRLLLVRARNGDVSGLVQEFHRARKGPQFEGDKDATLKHYDSFSRKAQVLIDEASRLPFDEVFATYEDLQAAWGELQKAHREADASIQIATAVLNQRLLSGDLTKG
jgi:predicted DNA-binding WGR domain protein